MPPSHQRVRHSAQLKANPLVHLSRTMDDEGSNICGPAKLPQDHVPCLTIQWQSDRALTDILVNYLTTHPADCRVLFYSDSKKAMSTIDDGASGSDKGQVHTTLAKLIFTDHPKYGHAYATNAKKFCDGVCNRIGTLRGKYKKLKATFSSTGAGVMPDGGTQMKNLLDAALSELPWYTELDAIWHTNLSMAAKTHSLKPGVDHTGTLFSLVKLRDGAGPPTQFNASAPPPMQFAANPQPPPHAYSLHDTHPSSTPPSHQGQQYPPRFPPAMPYAGGSCGDPSIDPTLQQSGPARAFPSAPPYNWSPHLPGRPASDNDDNDDMDIQETSLRDAFHHLEGDEGGGFSKATGKKRQLPSSPSPPPKPPKPFTMPAKSLASVYNSCLAFGSKKQPSRGRHRRLPSEISVSASAPSSTTRNTTTSSLDYFMSSTPHMSLPNSASGLKKKKAKSDVMQHVDEVKDELASMQSDVMSRHDNKHHRFLTKLEAKTEHTCDTKRYEWLHATREHEALQATVSHQRLQETRDTEICLRETDI